ncbi:ATP-dependent DNA helicase chl1 [Coemansia sp. S146]|nr:ATP-dependent DNA helicase chl1 [Coemansia sp. S146]
MVTRVLEETTPAECLPTPQAASEFSFPIATPYSIQLDFMQRLFETIEKREFAIFETSNAVGLDSDVAQQKYSRWVANTRRKEATERKKGMMASRRAAPTDASKKRKPNEDGNGSDDEMMVVEAYYSGDEENAQQKSGSKLDDDGEVQYSAAVRKLLERRAGNRPLYDISDDDNSDNDNSGESALPPKEPSLCVNDRARQGAQSIHAINERCLGMQTAGSKKSARCGYLPLQHMPMLDFRDATASVIMDIEELANEGRRRCTYPYYGARASINGAQVVALPYNTLLSRSARQAMGISLAGNVAIVDEAHNLVDTILAIHSIALDWRTVRATVADSATRVVSVNEFLTLAHADHINVYKIDRYLWESKLGRKLNVFSDRLGQNDLAASSKRPTTAVRETVPGPAPVTAVAAFEAFMECLGKPDRTGSRLVIRTIPSTNSGTEVELKFLQLDPSEAFGEICAEAWVVVLAGGTMKPTTSGPTGTALRFAHGDQGDSAKLRKAGLALAALCQAIPGAIVAFFPSYALLDRMHRNWSAAGIVDRIAKRKPVFVESSTSSGDVLELYPARVRAVGSTGALLFSVAGGRLSEGINFSDDLGRTVVMVGVPFPSLASPELAERLAYYEGMSGAQSTASGIIGSMGLRAKELYESLCMRAVNQSIGRAIPHRNDYVATVFLDARYAESRIAHKLPTLIAGSSVSNDSSVFGLALA